MTARIQEDNEGNLCVVCLCITYSRRRINYILNWEVMRFSSARRQRGSPLPENNCEKQTQGWNDKTIIELGYRKISWFVSVSQINYLPRRQSRTILLIILQLKHLSATSWLSKHWWQIMADFTVDGSNRTSDSPWPTSKAYLHFFQP